ncbi:MAG: response regulator [Devosia sp.]|jgi:DNA-binding response OmpR family regulator
MTLDKPLVLLIEDEALLALALEAELIDAGYDVLLALDGRDASAHIEKDAVRFACVVTDIRLPGLDGWAIAKRARELVPSLPLVYMSGDSAPDWSSLGVRGSIMLTKPFAIAQLTTAVAQVRNSVAPPAS